jgi:hypothetical protein
MKLVRIFSLVFIMLLSGCGCIKIGLDMVDLLSDPVPICDEDSAGTQWEGKVCLKYSDGSYHWSWTYPEGIGR